MNFTANGFTVTLALLVAFALFIIFVRLKNWLDSNVPIIFYILMLIFVKSQDNPGIPIWLILASFALTLMLRFEFMSPLFVKVIKTLEILTLAAIIYVSVTVILSY